MYGKEVRELLTPNQLVEAHWCPANKDYYESKGYKFTGYKKIVMVHAEDLMPNSTIKVRVVCDYCGKEYITAYKLYLKGLNDLNKNSCKYCWSEKAKEINLKNLGVENPFASEAIKNKIASTNIAKYGVANVSQSKEIIEKRKQTSLEKRGVECPFQDPEVIAKIRETLSKNNSIPSSKAEQEMCNNLIELYGEDNCHPSYPFDRITFDCLVETQGAKIDVEYDGYYWHKDRTEYDKRRNYFVTNRGYKVLRFLSKNEVPSKEELSQAIEELVKSSKMVKIIQLDV